MSLIRSAINQVGRDMGRVVSNQIFKDAHSIPIRNSSASPSTRSSPRQKRVKKSEFDKAVSFQTSFRPPTLVNKLVGAYTALKNEAKEFIQDDYLDNSETEILLNSMMKFKHKVEDVVDVLELDEDKNKNELDKVEKIIVNVNTLFREVMTTAIEGAEEMSVYYHSKAIETPEPPDFGKHMMLSTVWLEDYSLNGEFNWFNFFLLNGIIICLAIYVSPYLLALYLIPAYKGFKSHRDLQSELDENKMYYMKMCTFEKRRSETFKDLLPE
ncbi:hypothetical protein KUV50_06085 [Membranicola marinus]|uniref:Uncharacterized protein n=1 Tax=Membranihabitans marinus TaxID=1227546 RepID=A0A953LCE5_9BACT|nr:hypothetical protein [Membranihabitans marinus]MBY5957689.1 hypothetical protein [Membranihabitans marinus]